jgi:hypothetical protein
MRPIEAAPAVFLIIVSTFVLFGTANLAYWADITPGPRFFPVWIAGISIVLSLALLVQIRRGTDTGVTDLPERSAFVRIALTIAAMATFAVAAPLGGMVTDWLGWRFAMAKRRLRAPQCQPIAQVKVNRDREWVRHTPRWPVQRT